MRPAKRSFRTKLLLAWGIGTGLNLIAIVFSYFLDLPMGYTVVALYTLAGIASTLISAVGKATPASAVSAGPV